MRRLVIVIGVALAAVLPLSAAATATSDGLWIVDDSTDMVYKIDPSGGIDSSVSFTVTAQFGMARATSDISIDNTDGTLWLAAEESPSIGRPGGVANWTTGGVPLSGITEATYGGDGTEGVSVDLWAEDGSLWVVDDPIPATNAAGETLANVRHIDRSGSVLGSWPSLQLFTSPPSTQAIAVDPADGTLWITDNAANRIFHFSRPAATDASLTEIERIHPVAPGKFGIGTPGVDHLTNALQGITVAPDGTLWVTARTTGTFLHGKIFHITRTGELIESFLSSTVYGGENPTGIAYACTTCRPAIEVSPSEIDFGVIPPAGSVTTTVTIANTGSDTLTVDGLEVTGSADLILGSAAPSTPFGLAAGGHVEVPVVYTPTGGDVDTGALSIASNDPAQGTVTVPLRGSEQVPRPVVDLGAAEAFALLGLDGVKISMSNTSSGVIGSAGLGPNNVQNFREGFITGTLYVDPTANNAKTNTVAIGGGTVVAGLARAVADARSAASTATSLTTTRTYKDLKSTATITVDTGLNVLSVGNVDLGGGKTVTIVGGSSSVVVVNVTGKFRFSGGGGIRLQGGLTASHVFFNAIGSGEDVALSGGSTVTGRILAPGRKVALSGASIVNGLVIAGGDIALSGGSQVRTAA